MDLGLTDKVFVVTGGASGIGEAIVRELASEGAFPVCLDRNADRGAEVVRSLPQGEFVQVDLTDSRAVEEAISSIIESSGRIDGVVNNAGINDGAGLDASVDDFRNSLERNLVSCFSVVRSAAAQLRKTKGSIVNIGSKVAMTGQGGTSGYAAAKGGLVALTREWALDLAADCVRVNAVIPAEVWTPMYESWLDSQSNSEARKTEIESRIPLGQRMTTPEEIAAMTVFLLSSKSSHTTGQILHVDGGYAHFDRAYTPPDR
ncbi:MAG: L-fucose dehydrogenase [Verrucomicrobiales bacterium]|jgi:L-fucose dehydrogenase